MDKKGFIFSLEGGEACGKGTQLKLLKQYLTEHNYDFIDVREPGGTELGEKIRDLLLHSKGYMDPTTEALLFNAARAQLLVEKVIPALKEGKIVLYDRYYDSTLAYQGYASGKDPKVLRPIIDFAIAGNVPDLTILLDISYDQAMARKQGDPNLRDLDRIEQKGREYHENVRKGYLDLASKESRFHVIDASQSIETVHKAIVNEFEKRYNAKQA